MYGIYHTLEQAVPLLLVFAGGLAVGWMLAGLHRRRFGAQGAHRPEILSAPLGEGPLLPERQVGTVQRPMSETRNEE